MQIRKRFLAGCFKESASSDDDDNEDKRTVFCGNLSVKVTEALLFELFLNAGPVSTVEIPKSKDGHLRKYAFITYVHVSSVPYALQLFADVQLYSRRLVLGNRTFTNKCKFGNSLVKPMLCGSNECPNRKKKIRVDPSNWQNKNGTLQTDQNVNVVEKTDIVENRLPRPPLCVSNEVNIPRKTVSVPAATNCMNYIFQDCERRGQGTVAVAVPSTYDALPAAINLTSQYLINYICLMQKVITHWPRFQ